MKHGTGGYARGCRCDECRAAHREQARRYYDKANERRRKWRREHPEEARQQDRERYLSRREAVLEKRRLAATGVTRQQFAEMLAAQSGRCAICKTDVPNGRGDWHVDHDHATGRVRGLLCHKCNVGLGHFNDSEELLVQAIAYLRKS